jgi:hypothetical protein
MGMEAELNSWGVLNTATLQPNNIVLINKTIPEHNAKVNSNNHLILAR